MSILGKDDGKFQLGWFRGGRPQRPAAPGRLAAALAWARSMKGAPYIGTNGPIPHLPGRHVLVARRACGCIMVHCPQEPEVVTLSGPWCVGDDHDTEPERATPNGAPASVGSSPAPSNVTGISAEALTLAAGGMAEFPGIYCVPQVSQDPIYDRLARSALAAAMPELRRQIAEEIAAEIEELDPDKYDEFAVGIGAAAAKAREIGGQHA